MSFRLIDSGWDRELQGALAADHSALRIICPFVKLGALLRLLGKHRPGTIEVITRYSLDDFAAGVSDLASLRTLLGAGGRVRGIKNLHAKMYLFGSSQAVVTSANLTTAALDRNQEFGFTSDDPTVVGTCHTYFDHLWNGGQQNLTYDHLNEWDAMVTRHLETGFVPGRPAGLGDFGADVGLQPPPLAPDMPIPVTDARQAFVKFLGTSRERASLSFSTFAEVERAGAHRYLAYPASKRPRAVRDGAIMFIGRLTKDPADIRIFGRAIGLQHVDGRDDATAADLALRGWHAPWTVVVRVHDGEFVAGNMANGVSLNDLMDSLGSDAFKSTQKNAALGTGNVSPRMAYMQQAAVELSPEGLAWLNERFELATKKYGRVPAHELAQLDWPEGAW